MEKKINHYLNLYLGCEAMTDQGKGTLCIVTDGTMGCGGDWAVLLEENSDTLSETDAEYIKPILRPLSSMTEEEMQECGNLAYDFRDEPDLNKWEWKDFQTLLDPSQFKWLLLKGLDLFNLIPEGLALDATQQPLTQDK